MDLQAAIDRDLHVIHLELHKETQRGWTNAEQIYRRGAFSKPVAKIGLNTPLAEEIPVGSTVRGLDVDGFDVSGKLYRAASAADEELMVQYDIDEVQANYVNCQVGANPAPNVAGCEYDGATLVATAAGKKSISQLLQEFFANIDCHHCCPKASIPLEMLLSTELFWNMTMTSTNTTSTNELLPP